MEHKKILLRREEEADYRVVEEVTREAFWNRHGPGCSEHYLLHIMRTADCFIKDLDIVAEVDGKIVGNIVYTKTNILKDDGVYCGVLTFGPVSVLPGYQGMGIGSRLIEYTKSLAGDLLYRAVLIYGDPDFYGRFGFAAASDYKIASADNMYAAALQALELCPGALSGITGRFLEGEMFELDEADVKEFDKNFTHKDLLVGSPSQERFLKLLAMKTPRTALK